MRWHICHDHKQIGKACDDACARSKQQIWHVGIILASWKWRFRAPPTVLCRLSLELFFNIRGEGSFLHCKHLFLYNYPLIFIFSPLVGDRLMKKRFQISTYISKMVIVVWNMREVFVIPSVPNKTHVLILVDSHPYIHNLYLNKMTHTIFQISGKLDCEDQFDSL